MNVRELMEILAAFNPEMKVEIVDADTGWFMERVNVDLGDGESIMFSDSTSKDVIYIWASYDEHM